MHALLRCYAELNDFLPSTQRYTAFAVDAQSTPTIRQAMERSGIPTAAVDLILVNGEPESLDYRFTDGDRISAFPVFESFDIAGTTKVRISALREVRFVADVHLGKLASHLRMLGFDTLYRNDFRDDELLNISVQWRRTLLSKDHALIANPTLTHAILVQSQDPREQLLNVLTRLDLFHATHPFTRCIECNSILEPAEKSRILHRLPPKVAVAYEAFRLCPECDRLYWKGSHFERMREFIRGIGIVCDP